MVVFAAALLLNVASVVWALWASQESSLPIVVPTLLFAGLILTAVSVFLFVSIRGRRVAGGSVARRWQVAQVVFGGAILFDVIVVAMTQDVTTCEVSAGLGLATAASVGLTVVGLASLGVVASARGWPDGYAEESGCGTRVAAGVMAMMLFVGLLVTSYAIGFMCD
jgi:hypothetical protein